MKITKEQQIAIKRKFEQQLQFDKPITTSYLTFRRTVVQGFDCLMLPFGSMWLGIELDGYTHS